MQICSAGVFRATSVATAANRKYTGIGVWRNRQIPAESCSGNRSQPPSPEGANSPLKHSISPDHRTSPGHSTSFLRIHVSVASGQRNVASRQRNLAISQGNLARTRGNLPSRRGYLASRKGNQASRQGNLPNWQGIWPSDAATVPVDDPSTVTPPFRMICEGKSSIGMGIRPPQIQFPERSSGRLIRKGSTAVDIVSCQLILNLNQDSC